MKVFVQVIFLLKNPEPSTVTPKYQLHNCLHPPGILLIFCIFFFVVGCLVYWLVVNVWYIGCLVLGITRLLDYY